MVYGQVSAKQKQTMLRRVPLLNGAEGVRKKPFGLCQLVGEQSFWSMVLVVQLHHLKVPQSNACIFDVFPLLFGFEGVQPEAG